MRTDLSPEHARLNAYARSRAIGRAHVFGLKPSRRVAKAARAKQHKRNRKAHDMAIRHAVSLNNNLI